jgi:hypothetical protein
MQKYTVSGFSTHKERLNIELEAQIIMNGIMSPYNTVSTLHSLCFPSSEDLNRNATD